MFRKKEKANLLPSLLVCGGEHPDERDVFVCFGLFLSREFCHGELSVLGSLADP